jgi:hypothetical protein
MPKKVYVIKGYEDKGKQFRRTTDREYTHAVLVKRLEDGVEFVEGYCGRPDLAQKLLAATSNRLDRSFNVDITIHEVVRIK